MTTYLRKNKNGVDITCVVVVGNEPATMPAHVKAANVKVLEHEPTLPKAILAEAIRNCPDDIGLVFNCATSRIAVIVRNSI